MPPYYTPRVDSVALVVPVTDPTEEKIYAAIARSDTYAVKHGVNQDVCFSVFDVHRETNIDTARSAQGNEWTRYHPSFSIEYS